jgi:hypothetical protein
MRAALLFAVTGHCEDTSIRPFMVNMPEEAFVDLRRRLAATRWPSREVVTVVQRRCWRACSIQGCAMPFLRTDDGRGTRLALLECTASVRAIARAKSGKCYLGNSSAIERMEGARRERGAWLRERDVSTMWIEGSKLRTGITATRTSHNREAHTRVSDGGVISREGLYESP